MEITIYSLGEGQDFNPVVQNALGFRPDDSKDTAAHISFGPQVFNRELIRRLKDEKAIIRILHLYKPYESLPTLSKFNEYHPNYLRIIKRSHMDDFYYRARWLINNEIEHYYEDSEVLREELREYAKTNHVFARRIIEKVRPALRPEEILGA